MRRDPFGHRLDPPNPASLCADLAGRLRSIAEGPDTPTARAEVEAALGSKWWGIRVLAIRAIGRWRTERDRAWLVERTRRLSPTATELRNTSPGDDLRWRAQETAEARQVLFRRVPWPEDSDWLLDLWFVEPSGKIWVSWLSMVPEVALRSRIAAEIRGGDPERLQRAIWLLYHNGLLANRTEILGHLTGNSHKVVARLAEGLLTRLERRLRAPPPRRHPTPS